MTSLRSFQHRCAQNDLDKVPITIYSKDGIKDFVYGTDATIDCEVLTHTTISQKEYNLLIQARIEGDVDRILTLGYNF